MCNFCDPNLVTFYFYGLTHFFRLNKEHFTFHLRYKHSGTFANRKYEKLSYPKIRKCAQNSLERCSRCFEKLRNHSNEEKGKEEKKERGEGKEENRKKQWLRLVVIIGSLRCHYGDGNEIVKKAVGVGQH